MAGGIALAVILWMLSGVFNNPAVPVERTSGLNTGSGGEISDRLMRVRVRQLSAREIVREVVVSARTEPNRSVELRAETDGVVTKLGAGRGRSVTQGEHIVDLDMRDRNARLNEAEALVEQRQLEYEATENLRGQQFTSEVQIAEANARLKSAVANQERILMEIRHTSLTAPFDALVQERAVEIGDFVRVGDPVAYLVDIDPLIIAGEVNEREVGKLEVGSPGTAHLVNGIDVEGTIRYIAPVADENTRTFRVELAVSNPDSAMRAGLTAEMRLSAGRIIAHSLTPALLTLSDDGTVGVKIVDEYNIVRFYPVEIVGSTDDGISVTGLPDDLRLITVGQGFVTDGQRVEPVPDSIFESNIEYERAY